MAIDLDALLNTQREYLESIEPIDVPILVGDRVLTARIPFLKGSAANDAFAPYGYPNPLYRDPVGSWFRIPDAARTYPDITLIDEDGSEDDLYVLRSREPFYRWPEVYDALHDEDQLAVQSAIWGLYIGEPKQRHDEAVNRHA